MKLHAVRYLVPTGESKVVLCERVEMIMRDVSAEDGKVTKTLFVQMVKPVNVPTDLTDFGIVETKVESVEIPANLMFEMQELECIGRPTSEPLAAGEQPGEQSDQSH